MDAITLLKDDHKTVEKLFKQFEQAGDKAYVEKQGLVDRMIEELSVHAAVEEQLFYPVTRATVPAVEDSALESLEEHHVVKWVLSELEGMDPHDERFTAKVTVLIDSVRHHVEEEEGEYFPRVRSELGRKALAELGDAMATARQTAPTRPHPRSPDEPPANLVVGTAAGVVDRVSDTVSGLAQGSVAAVQDVVDRVRGTKRARRAPTGAKAARTTAASVRGAADHAVTSVRDAADTAVTSVSDATDEAVARVVAAIEDAKQTGEQAAASARAKADAATTARSAARASGPAKAARSGKQARPRTAARSAKRAGPAKVTRSTRTTRPAKATRSTTKTGPRKATVSTTSTRPTRSGTSSSAATPRATKAAGSSAKRPARSA